MKQSNRVLLAAGVALSLLAACKKKNEIPVVEKYTVQVTYPSSYLQTNAQGVTVTLTNATTNTTVTATTGTDGTASFSGMIEGSYQLFATVTLSAAAAAELNGTSAEISLNASALNQQVTNGGSVTLQLTGGKTGGLVFKQVYYTCSKTTSGTSYLQDQFYELYNNTSDTLYADSLCLADVQGNPGITATSVATGFQSDQSNVYVRNIWMVPGTGKTYPVAPGKSFLIAQTAINHKTDAGNTNSIDLGTGIADMEVYVNSGKDVDNPDVPNMLGVYTANQATYWLTYVYGASMIIFRHPDPASLPGYTEPGTTATALYVQVPVDNVIDGVEFLGNVNYASLKRIPTVIDAGFNACSGTYNGEAMMRKVKGTSASGQVVLQDTNNSTQDFEVIKPPVPKAWK